MDLIVTLAALTQSLGRHGRALALARERYAALEPYATPDAILAALKRESPLDARARGEIVGALCAEEQRTHHPLWQGLLYSAFTPLLIGLRTELATRDSGVEDEDLDQAILALFLYAARGAPATHLAPLGIKRRLVDELERVFTRDNKARSTRAAMERFEGAEAA